MRLPSPLCLTGPTWLTMIVTANADDASSPRSEHVRFNFAVLTQRLAECCRTLLAASERFVEMGGSLFFVLVPDGRPLFLDVETLDDPAVVAAGDSNAPVLLGFTGDSSLADPIFRTC